MSRAAEVTIPVMVNPVAISEGQELVLPVAEPSGAKTQKKQDKRRTWKDDLTPVKKRATGTDSPICL